jgi:hypothetical protein
MICSVRRWGPVSGLLRWFKRFFKQRVAVAPEGRGYRVNGEWCSTQVEVRERLEALELSEAEIIRLLRELNTKKYGDPQR